MKDDLKLALTMIAILLTFIFVGMVAISLKLDGMEQRAKDRYLSTVIAIDFTRDRVKVLDKQNDEIIKICDEIYDYIYSH